MKIIYIQCLLLCSLNIFFISCTSKPDNNNILIINKHSGSGYERKGALLTTKFESFDDFLEKVTLVYNPSEGLTLNTFPNKSSVIITYSDNHSQIKSTLSTGITEQDFLQARDGNFISKLKIGLLSPKAVFYKENMKKIEYLARNRPWMFDNIDIAFYDIAVQMMDNILEEDKAIFIAKDFSEKGFINTFNHITAQAFMTSLFTEGLADYIADIHERSRIPELINGNFSDDQINDLNNGPLDNYIDMLNNEWGQELGKQLKEKYDINHTTYWTPTLMAQYLNDIQAYYSWTFQIGFHPFSQNDQIVTLFTKKLNSIMRHTPILRSYY